MKNVQITQELAQELIIDFTKDIQILTNVLLFLEQQFIAPQELMQRNRDILEHKKMCLEKLQIAFLAENNL